MDYLGKKVIKLKINILLDSLDPKDLIDLIIQEDVLDESERQLVTAEVTRQGRVRKFLEFLRRKEGGFDKLVKMLNMVQMNWISMPLIRERDRLIAAGEDAHFIFSLDQNKITTRLDDQQCLSLNYLIAPHWKIIAIRIGITEDLSHHPNNMVGYELLRKWRNWKLDEANFRNLIAIIDQEGIDYDEKNLMAMFS